MPLVLFGLGAAVTLLNQYASWIRYAVHRMSDRSRESFRFVSGAPLVGSVALWGAAVLFAGRGRVYFGLVAVTVSLFDTGGPHWLLVALWLENRRQRTRRTSPN